MHGFMLNKHVVFQTTHPEEPGKQSAAVSTRDAGDFFGNGDGVAQPLAPRADVLAYAIQISGVLQLMLAGDVDTHMQNALSCIQKSQ